MESVKSAVVIRSTKKKERKNEAWRNNVVAPQPLYGLGRIRAVSDGGAEDRSLRGRFDD